MTSEHDDQQPDADQAEAEPRALTYRQAADSVGVSIQTVRRWCASGKLRRVFLAGKVPRILLADLHAFACESPTARAV
ncbi:MAG: helix-turn-helix domain-containing protein [Planctomycetota bacterium]